MTPVRWQPHHQTLSFKVVLWLSSSLNPSRCKKTVNNDSVLLCSIAQGFVLLIPGYASLYIGLGWFQWQRCHKFLLWEAQNTQVLRRLGHRGADSDSWSFFEASFQHRSHKVSISPCRLSLTYDHTLPVWSVHGCCTHSWLLRMSPLKSFSLFGTLLAASCYFNTWLSGHF